MQDGELKMEDFMSSYGLIWCYEQQKLVLAEGYLLEVK